jgi:hypothetical protein
VSSPTSADEWADRYGELRADGPAAINAWLGIPLAVAALIGMLWSAPVPAALAGISPLINFGTLFVMAAFVYYCILSIRLALGGLLFLAVAAFPSYWLERHGWQIWPTASAVFAPTFCWLLIETRRATGRLLILLNLQYLMLGPIWLMRAAYRRIGIGY